MVFRGTGFGGAPGEVRQRFSDLREVAGLRLPFHTSSTFDGEPYIEVTAEEILVDGAVTEEEFARPAGEEEVGGSG